METKSVRFIAIEVLSTTFPSNIWGASHVLISAHNAS